MPKRVVALLALLPFLALMIVLVIGFRKINFVHEMDDLVHGGFVLEETWSAEDIAAVARFRARRAKVELTALDVTVSADRRSEEAIRKHRNAEHDVTIDARFITRLLFVPVEHIYKAQQSVPISLSPSRAGLTPAATQAASPALPAVAHDGATPPAEAAPAPVDRAHAAALLDRQLTGVPCPDGTTPAGVDGKETWCEIVGGGEPVRHGPYQLWHEDGATATIGEFRRGRRHGVWKSWHKSGERAQETNFVDGAKHGRFLAWDERGDVVSDAVYRDGKHVP